MSEWQTKMSGYASEQTYNYDYGDVESARDQVRYYGNPAPGAFSQGAMPPPSKSARPDFDQAAGDAHRSFADARAGFHPAPITDPYAAEPFPQYPQTSSSIGGSNYLQPPSHHQYSIREEWNNVPQYSAYVSHKQSEDRARHNRLDPFDVNQSARDHQDMTCPPPSGHFTSFGPDDYDRGSGVCDYNAPTSNLHDLPAYRKPDDYRSPYLDRIGNDIFRDYSSQSFETGSYSLRPDDARGEWHGGNFAAQPNDCGRKRSGSPSLYDHYRSHPQAGQRHVTTHVGFDSFARAPTRHANWNGDFSSETMGGHRSAGVSSLLDGPLTARMGGRSGQRRHVPMGSVCPPRRIRLDDCVAPMNRIIRPQWGSRLTPVPRMMGGPLNAIRTSPANFVKNGNFGEEPVSLLDATFAPPAGLPMLAKRERSVARWAKAVRKEWPAHERRIHELNRSVESANVGRNLQYTSFLSDVLQREMRKNMTFVYGTMRDVALADRGGKGEFFPRDASETSVLVDLYYDDVFVAHGCGVERFDAREKASQNALQLFLRDRVYVVGCYRLWEGELIPGFCVSNSRQPPQRLPPYPRNPKRERAATDKPDSKTLPWLQVNPSSKMDTSARLKPKSIKDFFILINGRGDDYSESDKESYDFSAGFPRSLNAVAVMNNSAQFNQMRVEYRMSSVGGGGHRCTIALDKQLVGDGDGWDSNQARRAACEAVLNELSKTQPVVRMQLDKAEIVTRSQLDGWSEKLARESPDWVATMDAKLDPANPMKEPHLQKVMDDAEAFLKQYVHDERQEPLKFGAEFTHDERMAIHKAARRLGLASKPYGPQWRLYQVVSLRFSLEALKRILLSKGVAGRYALVARGSVDFSHLHAPEEETTEGGENGGGEEEAEDNPLVHSA